MSQAYGSEFGAHLAIDLDALAENWRRLARRVPNAECGAVVKANAYGCGIEEVVPALGWAGCRTFFVAHLSEARRVRKVAPLATIYVLNGLLPGSASAYHAIGARPVLGAPEEIAEWALEGGGQTLGGFHAQGLRQNLILSRRFRHAISIGHVSSEYVRRRHGDS